MGNIRIIKNTETGQYLNRYKSNIEYAWCKLEQLVVENKGSEFMIKKRHHYLQAHADVLIKFIEKNGTNLRGSINIIECLESEIPSHLSVRINRTLPFEESIRPYIKKSISGNPILSNGLRILTFSDINFEVDSEIEDQIIAEENPSLKNTFKVLYGICFGSIGMDSLHAHKIIVILTEEGILFQRNTLFGNYRERTLNYFNKSKIIESINNYFDHIESEPDFLEEEIIFKFMKTQFDVHNNELIFESEAIYDDSRKKRLKSSISLTENGTYLISIEGIFNLETLQIIDLNFNEISSNKLLDYFPSIFSGKKIMVSTKDYKMSKLSGKNIFDKISSSVYGFDGGNLYIDKVTLSEILEEETILQIINQRIFDESSLLNISDNYSLSEIGREIIFKYKLLLDE